MIRSLYRSSKGNFTFDVPITHWRVALHDKALPGKDLPHKGGLLWVDFFNEPPEKIEPLLREVFGFHPLAINDALGQTHVPKIDNWTDYVCIVAHNVEFNATTLALTTSELDIFLGANYVVTHHTHPIAATDRVWSNSLKDQRRLESGPDHLLYDLLDSLTADYLPAIDALDDAIDAMEDEVFNRPSNATLNTIFSIKRAVLHLRRIIVPQREVLNKLARDEYAPIDPEDRIYFRDIYDHLVRLADLNESLRDLAGGALDTYLSVTSNRINEVMKVLTIISALFMPISFVAGFWGMNFFGAVNDPGWSNPIVLTASLVVMLSVPLGMMWWFKRQGWL